MDDVDVLPEPELPVAARQGDPAAFEELVAGHRRELYAHRYRMPDSVQDAEDGLQESLLAAWRGLSGFERRSSLRGRLYRVGTNACVRPAARRISGRRAGGRTRRRGPRVALPAAGERGARIRGGPAASRAGRRRRRDAGLRRRTGAALRLLSTHSLDCTDNTLVRYAPGDRDS
ncbi:hypothetical protein J7E87_05130 [Streptomyces sp. ISL-1]|uniref:sigma factor n=1 Tax=Streptomyces sp. ISL-1 TaxID=2817657 RepID=UPI001BE71308|nr:sigma factor [Streptomyces sp. ISL-1]MBT2388821.1 hypothetical protein [Streptomyces sp. ISL-1]